MSHSNSAETFAHHDGRVEKAGVESQGDASNKCRQDAFGDKASGCAKETLAKAENGDNKFLDIPPLDYKGKAIPSPEQSKDGKAKDGEPSEEVQEKLNNRPEVKDAQEFQKKFGKNPNSPEAIAWLQNKIGERTDEEVKQQQSRQHDSGLVEAGSPGLSYGQMLLMNISAANKQFNPDGVSWSYFRNGSQKDPNAGWHQMRGFKESNDAAEK